MLESLAFVVIGFKLPELWRALADQQDDPGVPSQASVLIAASVIFLTILVSRFVWMFPGTYLPRVLVRSIRETSLAPPGGPS